VAPFSCVFFFTEWDTGPKPSIFPSPSAFSCLLSLLFPCVAPQELINVSHFLSLFLVLGGL